MELACPTTFYVFILFIIFVSEINKLSSGNAYSKHIFGTFVSTQSWKEVEYSYCDS